MPAITIADIDSDSRVRISSIIHETVLAAPGTYEIPALCRIVESKSIYNANAIGWVVDDELEFGGLSLDTYNRLYSTRNRRMETQPVSSIGPISRLFGRPAYHDDCNQDT